MLKIMLGLTLGKAKVRKSHKPGDLPELEGFKAFGGRVQLSIKQKLGLSAMAVGESLLSFNCSFYSLSLITKRRKESNGL
jgi:hypothetical protein